MSAGPYNWIKRAAEALRRAAPIVGVSELGSEIDTLLSGVPVPQEDLGFNSPADRAARAGKIAPQMFTALEAIRDRWSWDEPEPLEEDYDDTESAYNNGYDVARYECASMARDALAGLDVTLRRY